ncbi:MAG: FAD-dependent oxidoreductase [Shimia sp.]|uniref:FAD-dependent oxidoreductase n=1 Tax=Shimia sp. TaxID=1954381 RepID=UPI00405A2F4E
MQIAIAGAGIGGLAAATLLRRAGHDTTVFDQFNAPAPVGSGLVIQPAGQDVLRALGVLPDALAKGATMSRMLGHEATSGRKVLDVHYIRRTDHVPGLAIHRATLFDLLLRAANDAGVTLLPSHRVQAAQNGTLTFEGGTTRGEFDLIIDASGASSVLSPLTTRALPYGAIWGTVPWPDATALPKNELRQTYRRASNMVGVMPAGQLPGQSTQCATIFWSLPADSGPQWRAEGVPKWHAQVASLWPDAMPFFEQITATDQMTMARYSHGTLRHVWRDRLVFIGDAAHRASPQLGQGANMALLDAWALARALTHSQNDLSQALPRYAKARRWHTRIYQALSAAFTPQYQSDSRFLPFLRDRILFPASQIPPIPRIMTTLVRGHLAPPILGLPEQGD